MEPRQTSTENLPPLTASLEQQPAVTFEAPTLETAAEGGRNEQTERRLGQRVEGAVQQQSASAQSMALPSPVAIPQSDDDSAQTDDTATPMVAADDDLIEKEWVDKAKKVISDTRDDPYRREQEVKKLQVDYVKKRYGKAIGAPSDSNWET